MLYRVTVGRKDETGKWLYNKKRCKDLYEATEYFADVSQQEVITDFGEYRQVRTMIPYEQVTYKCEVIYE